MVDGQKLEPLEEVVCEIEDEFAGPVIDALSLRRAEVHFAFDIGQPSYAVAMPLRTGLNSYAVAFHTGQSSYAVTMRLRTGLNSYAVAMHLTLGKTLVQLQPPIIQTQ